MGKNSKPKNAFQIEDPDAPDNTQSVKIVKLKKIIQGEERNILEKYIYWKWKTTYGRN